ncbi:integrase core domain-containing protein [Jannaschia seohaensis]|uniref:integrase core domain-containing protein n=1 Tax=Jannaschia seohaensis TaxID=475081 RepID=UPI000D6BCCD6|nr:integrase core domain-containing protein [Jannaschia seohaensis]
MEPGLPWQNGNAGMRAELRDGDILYWLKETQIIIESRRKHSNTKRPHRTLGSRASARETVSLME